jgi:hypothetical protein
MQTVLRRGWICAGLGVPSAPRPNAFAFRGALFGKIRLIVNGGDHGRLLQASDHAIIIDRPRCCDTQGMAIQTSFAKKMTGSQDCNYRFLALLGNDSELDLALLDVEDRVRSLSL